MEWTNYSSMIETELIHVMNTLIQTTTKYKQLQVCIKHAGSIHHTEEAYGFLVPHLMCADKIIQFIASSLISNRNLFLCCTDSWILCHCHS